eukprot:12906976-Prorocentrum_lima.AAC.1
MKLVHKKLWEDMTFLHHNRQGSTRSSSSNDIGRSRCSSITSTGLSRCRHASFYSNCIGRVVTIRTD